MILPCWNALEYTKLCVDTLFRHTSSTKTPYHVIFIDNGSDDGTREYLEGLKAMYPEIVRVVHNAVNQGWVFAVNQGIAALSPEAEYVLLLNNDTMFVQENWLGRIIDKIHDVRQIAGAGPVSNAVSGRQHVAYDNPKIETEMAQPYLIGFCMLLKRECVDVLLALDGYFMDELFSPGGCDEIDVCMRLRDRGYSFLIDRTVYVHHFYSKTLSRITDDLGAFHNGKMKLLVEKHGQEKVNGFFGATPKRTLIGIPTLGQVHHKFLMTILTLEKPEGVAIETIPRSLPHVSRNQLAEMAIAHGFDYLFFLDDDMIFDQTHLLMKFMRYMEEHPEVDVIGPVAYMRNPPFYPCVFFEDPNNPPFYRLVSRRNEGVIEVDALTIAATLIRVDLLRRMSKPWFEFKRVGSETMGEDVYFCWKSKREHGAKILCDTDEQVWHIGDNLLVGAPTYEQYHTHPIVKETLKF